MNKLFEKITSLKKIIFYYFMFIKLKRITKNKNYSFLVFTPKHGNLGDHALAISAKGLLTDLSLNFIEIPFFDMLELSRFDLSIFNGNNIIFQPGGYLGTLWYVAEKIARKIIINCPDSKIVFLPNTIYYENDELGYKELNKAIKIYNSHKKLKLFVREYYSYNNYKDKFNNLKVYPDMVLYLKRKKTDNRTFFCNICIRNDHEKTISIEEENFIKKEVIDIFGENYKFTSMCLEQSISISDREKEVDKKFNEFASVSLIITDRLHGMVYAAITGTPCIVFNSKSPKVRGCYEWIKNLEYIKFAESPKDIPILWNSMKDKSYTYDINFTKHYNDLKNDVLKFLN